MFDLPNAPVLNQQVLEPNGAVLRWDGVKWVNVAGQVSSVTPAYNNVGRNVLHNPLFNIAQRGAGGFNTAAAYTVDRWRMDFSLDTMTVTQSPFNDAQRATIGDEAAENALVIGVAGNAGAAAYSLLSQHVENVQRLAGKTVTVSFMAYAAAGSPKVGVGLAQLFGSGGAPSAPVIVNATPVTLSTVTTRYSVTLAIPSVSCKTLGTNGDHVTRLGLWLSSGATNGAQAGGIGVQSGTFVFWGMQLEVGGVATPLEKPDPQQDLAKCQRFFQIAPVNIRANATAAQQMSSSIYFSVWMRANPTAATFVTGARSNVSGIGVVVNNYAGARINCNSVGVGDAYILDEFWSFSADL